MAVMGASKPQNFQHVFIYVQRLGNLLAAKNHSLIKCISQESHIPYQMSDAPFLALMFTVLVGFRSLRPG